MTIKGRLEHDMCQDVMGKHGIKDIMSPQHCFVGLELEVNLFKYYIRNMCVFVYIVCMFVCIFMHLCVLVFQRI